MNGRAPVAFFKKKKYSIDAHITSTLRCMIFQDNFIDTVENALIPNMLTQNGVSQI
jgi:hypothetical protein